MEKITKESSVVALKNTAAAPPPDADHLEWYIYGKQLEVSAKIIYEAYRPQAEERIAAEGVGFFKGVKYEVLVGGVTGFVCNDGDDDGELRGLEHEHTLIEIEYTAARAAVEKQYEHKRVELKSLIDRRLMTLYAEKRATAVRKADTIKILIPAK